MHRLRQVFQQRGVASAAPDETVLDVARTMIRRGVGAIPIVEGESVIGIFSERDLMTRVVVPGLDPATTPVNEVMTREVVTANLEDHVDFCVDKMRRSGCRHLAILVDGKLIAVLSLRDLLRDELAEQQDEIRSLRAYLHQTPP
jgi:CBS domain-containing protein